jgi:hypothetical protein
MQGGIACDAVFVVVFTLGLFFSQAVGHQFVSKAAYGRGGKPIPSKNAEGDEHARAKSIERNLRLVAHIIKNSYYKVQRNNSCFKTLINKGFPDIGLFSRLLYRRRQYLKPHILIVSGNILTTLKIYSCVTKLDTHATNYISK